MPTTNDPIADMLTRIRNAAAVHKPRVRVKRSKVCVGVARVLRDEGYIKSYLEIDDTNQGEIEIDLKYGEHGEQVIQSIRRYSRPSQRVYRKVDELERVCDGMGISVVSTNRGVKSDRECRAERLGGEVLCTVW